MLLCSFNASLLGVAVFEHKLCLEEPQEEKKLPSKRILWFSFINLNAPICCDYVFQHNIHCSF